MTVTADPRRPDPLESLRLETTPIEPDAGFAASLRNRIEADLGLTPNRTVVPSRADDLIPSTNSIGATVTDHRTYIPPTNASINVYLVVNDARAAIEWYAAVFDAVVTYEPIIMDDGRIGHCEMRIGDTTFAFADEFPEMNLLGPLARGGATASLTLHVPDVDATYARGVEHGGSGDREPADQFHGSRAGTLVDPFGHRWMVQTYLRDDGHAAGASPSAHPVPTQAQDLWNEVGYYVINVPEIEPARAFWGGLFGWQFADNNESPDGGTGAHVESGVVPFGLHAGASPATETWHPYFRVRDLQAAVARVRELGGTVESIDDYASGGNAVCRDDQGVRFDLWTPTDGY